jgi:hypothetical protein
VTRTKWLIVGCASVWVVLLAGWGSNHPRPSPAAVISGKSVGPVGSWVGRLRGRSGLVALVADGRQVAAYVCDNGKLGSWFFGVESPAAPFVLAGRKGAALNVRLGNRALGRFTKGGRTLTFDARRTKSTILFRADASAGKVPVVAGWIRDGTDVRGSVSVGSNLKLAPRLAPKVTVTVSPNVLATLSPAPMTPDTLGRDTVNSTKFVWGAVGDSFASGEGDPEHPISDPSKIDSFSGLSWGNDESIFVPDGFSQAADATTCHRSDNAPAAKVQRALEALYSGMSFVLGFVACGGAQTKDLLNDGYTGPNTTVASLLGHGRIPQPAQLARIKSLKDSEGQFDAIYMSIGGNDAGFGEIIPDCISPIGPHNCADKWDPLLTTRLATLSQSYTTVASRITTLFGAVPVLISEYPNPLDKGTSSDPGHAVCFNGDYDATGDVVAPAYDLQLKDNVTFDEAVFAYGISARFNATIAAAAANLHWTLVSSHVSVFAGHGICTAHPFANLNSVALHRQGHDVADTGPLTFAGGTLHPNDVGYTKYADAIEDNLRTFVDQRARSGLVAPVNVRIAAASRGGALTLRWDDRSTSEDAYEVEVLPSTPADASALEVPATATRVGQGFRQRIIGTGKQEFVANVSGSGRYLFRVRACQTGIRFVEGVGADLQCGPYSTQISGTNIEPAVPSSLKLTIGSATTAGSRSLPDVLSWSAVPDAIEYVVRVEPPNGSPVETRTSATNFIQSNPLGTKYKVAACNRVACSFYASP